MNALKNHIVAINDKARAWVAEDPENRCASILVEDVDFWAEGGITTPEQFDRDMLLGTYSDVHKMVRGYRPRWSMEGVSNEEIQDEIDALHDEQREEREREEKECHEAKQKEADAMKPAPAFTMGLAF